jgi:TPR repeat protein
VLLIAANQEHVEAQFELGKIRYHNSQHMNHYLKAVNWLNNAANQGQADAQFYLAEAYSYGRGVTLSYQQALEWYQKAAKQGNSDAQQRLESDESDMTKKMTEFNYVKVLEYSELANQRDIEAKYQLGVAFLNGDGVVKNVARTVELCKEAAVLGHSKAQFQLGLIYYKAIGKVVSRDYSTAIYWWREAAKQKNTDALFQLGYAFFYKEENDANLIEQAIEYWHEAAELGHQEAQYHLANAYYQGKGTELNQKEALKWWEKAGDQGHIIAQYNLGVAYLKGLGTAKNEQIAQHWFQKVAEHTDDNNLLVISAQYQLGIWYKNRKEYQQARTWLRQAARHGEEIDGVLEEYGKNWLKIVLDEKDIKEELITIVRQSAQQLLEDIVKLDEQEKTNQELEQKNQQIRAEKRKLEGLVRDYSHTLANEIHPQTIRNVAETLKQQGLKKEALLLYKAYRGEIFIWHQNELLLTQYRDSGQFRQKVLENRVEANSDSATDTRVYDIVNEALEKATANFLDESKYKTLQKVRRRMFGNNPTPLSERYQQFINQIVLEGQQPLEWVNNNLMPIQLSEFSEKWSQLRLQKYKCTEALLHKHFYELFLNTYKYSDFNGLHIRFFESQLEEKPYLFSQWTNCYQDNQSISTGNGLKGIKPI